jgi:anti-sigma regulatory factor (Ser/Thr protein kinase)/putative methionine-R-sulfoxide reductase with GAF domain
VDAGTGHVLLQPDPASVTRESGAEQLSDLYRLSDPGLSELGLEALLDEVLTRIRDVLAVDTVAVLLKAEEADELVARAAKGLEAEVEQRVRIPFGQGFAGRIASARQPIFIPDVGTADVVNPILRDIGVRSLLGVPLIVEAQLIGVLHVGSLTPRTFTAADAALLDLAAGRVAPGIVRARLMDALDRERLTAEALQRDLLPDRLPRIPDVDVAVRYVPARDQVGGDWYEVIVLPHGRIAIAIGDVVGHGVRAAALMAQMRAVLRGFALADPTPSAVLGSLDRYVQHSHPTAMATVAYAVLDPATGGLTCGSAGHPPPILAGPRGARMLDGDVAPPVGVRAFPFYPDIEHHVDPEETVLLYTDGLIERRGESLEVGLDRLQAAAQGDATPEVLCDRVLHELIGATSAADDVALVALRRLAAPLILRLRLPAQTDTLVEVRHRLRTWLHARGADEAAMAAIILAAGEAAANAVEHAYPPAAAHYDVQAEAEGDTVVITVTDQGRWRAPQPDTDRGRGLTIMRATMDDVAVTRGPDGTRIVMRRSLKGETA